MNHTSKMDNKEKEGKLEEIKNPVRKPKENLSR